MEVKLLWLDFLVLLCINLFSINDNWNIPTATCQVTVPDGDILVGNKGCNIKHDDSTLALDVVTITKSTKFILWYKEKEENEINVGKTLM